jgi:hypothetical protein
VNALQIESGDCWAAAIEHDMEAEVIDGSLEGSMNGVKHHGHAPAGDPDEERVMGRSGGRLGGRRGGEGSIKRADEHADD